MSTAGWSSWQRGVARHAAAWLACLPLAALACSDELLFVGQSDAGPALYLHGEGCQPPTRRLSQAGEVVFDAQWSPDGTRVAYVAAAGRFAQLFVLDLATGERRQLTQGEHLNAEPRWSPDGRSLVFISQQDGPSQIHRIEADGSQRRRLSALGTDESAPSWSPDGKRIAFVRIAGKRDVWVMDADGSNAQAIAIGPADEDSPTWSPDGSQLIYAVRQPQLTEFRRLDLRSGEAQRLLRHQAQAHSLRISPDGHRLAFLSGEGGRPMSLWVADADGGAARRLNEPSADDMSPQWTWDGRQLLYVGMTGARPGVRRIDVQGGESTALLQDVPGQQLQPLPRPLRSMAGPPFGARPAD